MNRILFISYLLVFLSLPILQSFAQQELNPEQIYEKVNDAVVIVLSFDSDGNLRNQGSGVLVFEKGYVYTNYHLMQDAINVKIVHGDLLIENVEIVGGDEDADFLVLKIPTDNLSVIKISKSEDIKIGQRVYAIGSPLGYENTISEGIISGFRTFDRGLNLIQITASISPGSSGGAVVNSKGELIGISTYTVAEGQNLNFAIPIGDLIQIKIKPFDQLKNNTAKLYSEAEETTKEKNYSDEKAFYYNPKALEYLEQGKELIETAFSQQNDGESKLHLKEAIVNFDKAINIDSNLVEAYYLAGKYQASPGYLFNYENAENYYNKVETFIDNSHREILYSPSNREILLNIATFYSLYGQHSIEMSLKEIEIYNKALRQSSPLEKEYSFMDISDDYIYFQIAKEYRLIAIGIIYSDVGELSEAIQYCNSAIEYYEKISVNFKGDPEQSEYYDILKDKKLAEALRSAYDSEPFYGNFDRKTGLLISSSDILYLYYPKTITKEKNNIVRTWIKEVNLIDIENRGNNYFDYSKSLYEFDLKNNKYRVLQYTSYLDNNVMDNENYPNAEWKYISPESIVEGMAENLKVITK